MKLSLVALLTILACTRDASLPLPPPNRSDMERARIRAAERFTDRYAHSRMSEWKIRAQAAGPRCSILLIGTEIILEDAMVDAMHHGSGSYDVQEGGVQQFYLEQSFRGVAYKDRSSRIWTYGLVSSQEAGILTPCH